MMHTFGLSDVQRAYYMGRRKEFELGGTSTHICYQFRTDLDVKRLEESFNKVIKRQGMLRARILNENEQMIMDDVPRYNIEVLDLRDKEDEEKRTIIEERRKEIFLESSDPKIWPQYSMLYIYTGDERNVLILAFDMLVSDSSSLCLIGKELEEYYNNPEKEIESIDSSYETYIEKQNENKKSKRYEKDRKYWMEKLETLPMAPVIPACSKEKDDKEIEPRSPIERITIGLDKNKWSKVKEQAEGAGLTPTSVVLAAYVMVLSKWSDNKDFTINLTMSERGKYKEKELVGDYTTALLVGIEEGLYKNKSLFEVAKMVSKEMILSYKHNSFNGIEVMREFSRKHNMGTRAIMPIVFTSMLFKDDIFEVLDFFGELECGITQTPQVILDCQAMEYHENLVVTWDYAKGYVDKKSLEIMANQMTELLEGEKTYKEVFSLCDADKKIWDEYNQTNRDYVDESLIDLIYKGATKKPEKVAIKDKDEVITYRDLWNISGEIGKNLRESGIQKGSYVCVLARRDISTIINILAVLKSGCAYVPILEEYPEKRRKFILDKCGTNVLLEPFDWNEKYGFVRENNGELINENNSDIDSHAYVIFTSGSTGEPKGVIISNKAAVNTIKSINEKFDVNEEDVILGISSLSFDLSVYDVFGSLSAGATLVLVKDQKDGEELARLCKNEKITIWNSVPALCELLLMEQKEENYDIRFFLLSGDWIPLTLNDRLKNKFKNSKVVSLGGATEGSIWSIYYEIESIDANWKSIPYGRPLDNQKMYILDESGELCPPEVVGEICIGGKGVANGYLNDCEKTEAAFVNSSKYGYIYRTGDYGRFHRENKVIEFLGRRDNQVKVNGYRIETGEIESVLLKIDGINKACVLVEGDQFKRIIAFYSLEYKVSEEDIREKMSEKLPSYMMPSRMIEIDDMPLSSNGKVDRNKLLELEKNNAIIDKPKSEKEKLLVELWKEILGIKEVGINQNFFSLGGDSIKAIQIISALKRKGYKVDMTQLYTHATIELLATIIEKSDEKKEYQEVKGTYPLTPSQEWLFRKVKHGRNKWNQYISITLSEKLDKKILEKTIEDLVRFHDVLRTIIVFKDGKYFNNTRDISNISNSYVLNMKSLNSEYDILRENDLLEDKFDLECGPLFGVAYYELPDKNILYFFANHMLTDGVSLRILLNDFSDIYEKRRKGLKVESYQAKTSYLEWASYINDYGDVDENYWKNVISNVREINSKYQIDTKKKYSEYTFEEVELGNNVLPGKDIEEYLLASFIKSYSKASGDDLISVEMEYHGRNIEKLSIDTEDTFGWFSYTYPVVFKNINKNIDKLIVNVHEMLNSVPYKGIDFSVIQSKANVDYPVAFHFNYLGDLDVNSYDGLVKDVGVGQHTSIDSEAIAAALVVVYLKDNKIYWQLSYDKDCFSSEMMDKLLVELKKSGKEEEQELDFILDQLYD